MAPFPRLLGVLPRRTYRGGMTRLEAQRPFTSLCRPLVVKGQNCTALDIGLALSSEDDGRHGPVLRWSPSCLPEGGDIQRP